MRNLALLSLTSMQLLVFTAMSAEVADFANGVGTNGWSVSGGVYVSPVYPNSVKEISIGYSSPNANDAAIIYALMEDGIATRVATVTAAASAATFEFPELMEFRCFRVEAGGDIAIVSFSVSQFPSLRAFPISGLSAHSYEQNFDSLAAITSTTGNKDWLNGTTLPCWQAWKGNAAISTFNYNAGKGRTGGIYALALDQKSEHRALGGYSTKDAPTSWGIAFTNDADYAVALSCVSYLAQQWGFANTNEHQFSFSCMVTNRMDWFSNLTAGWQDCCDTTIAVFGEDESHAMPVETPVTYPPEVPPRIEPGEVMLLKWLVRPPPSGYSALVGIDDLRVTFTRDSKPFSVHIVMDGK